MQDFKLFINLALHSFYQFDEKEGFDDDFMVGATLGFDGLRLGKRVCLGEGGAVGYFDDRSEGFRVGMRLGKRVSLGEGGAVGYFDGNSEGFRLRLGFADGSTAVS